MVTVFLYVSCPSRRLIKSSELKVKVEVGTVDGACVKLADTRWSTSLPTTVTAINVFDPVQGEIHLVEAIPAKHYTTKCQHSS